MLNLCYYETMKELKSYDFAIVMEISYTEQSRSRQNQPDTFNQRQQQLNTPLFYTKRSLGKRIEARELPR